MRGENHRVEGPLLKDIQCLPQRPGQKDHVSIPRNIECPISQVTLTFVPTSACCAPRLYHGNASLLTESLEVIQKASAVILSALEPPEAEVAFEQIEKLAMTG
jgi:hypothetical protein